MMILGGMKALGMAMLLLVAEEPTQTEPSPTPQPVRQLTVPEGPVGSTFLICPYGQGLFQPSQDPRWLFVYGIRSPPLVLGQDCLATMVIEDGKVIAQPVKRPISDGAK